MKVVSHGHEIEEQGRRLLFLRKYENVESIRKQYHVCGYTFQLSDTG